MRSKNYQKQAAKAYWFDKNYESDILLCNKLLVWSYKLQEKKQQRGFFQQYHQFLHWMQKVKKNKELH